MHQAINTGVASNQLTANQVVQRTEIDSEVTRLYSNIGALEGALNDLGATLYLILSPVPQTGNSGQAPTPVMNSPLGGALHTANDRLYAIARAVTELRNRVQL